MRVRAVPTPLLRERARRARTLHCDTAGFDSRILGLLAVGRDRAPPDGVLDLKPGFASVDPTPPPLPPRPDAGRSTAL